MVYLNVTVAKLPILRSILKHTGLTHCSVVVFRRLNQLRVAGEEVPLVRKSS